MPKKQKTTPIAQRDPVNVEYTITKPPTHSDSWGDHVQYFAGRQTAADLVTALPVTLISPEMGIVHDAAYAEGLVPPKIFYEVGIEMAIVAVILPSPLLTTFPPSLRRSRLVYRTVPRITSIQSFADTVTHACGADMHLIQAKA